MPARAGRLLVLVSLAATALAVLVSVSALSRTPRADAALLVDVIPVPLDASDPSRSSVGPLHYRGGLWLRSSDARFGGLSDLRVSPDGVQLVAVSDCGFGFAASLSYDGDGRLVGLADSRLVVLTDVEGLPLGFGRSDAESLVAANGELEVGFEGRARVLAYRADPPFAGPARSLPIPPGVRQCGSNQGIETMADVGDARRLFVCEGLRHPSSTVPAWVGRGGVWTEREYPLRFEDGWAGEPFRPTSATPLPGGDVLVLERRFPPVGARLVRLSRASLDGTGPLSPVEITRLEAPLTLDNFEGIEARPDASGRTLVYLVSDDNNCSKTGGSRPPALQRTLLLMFALEE
jgi:hypothetical protein